MIVIICVCVQGPLPSHHLKWSGHVEKDLWWLFQFMGGLMEEGGPPDAQDQKVMQGFKG